MTASGAERGKEGVALSSPGIKASELLPTSDIISISFLGGCPAFH